MNIFNMNLLPLYIELMLNEKYILSIVANKYKGSIFFPELKKYNIYWRDNKFLHFIENLKLDEFYFLLYMF